MVHAVSWPRRRIQLGDGPTRSSGTRCRRPGRRVAPPGWRAGRVRRSPRRAASSSRRRSARHSRRPTENAPRRRSARSRPASRTRARSLSRELPAPAGREQEGKVDDGKGERGVARDKSTVAPALRRRQRRRGELARAAERIGLEGVRPAPIDLQDGVGDQPGTERGGGDQEYRAPCGRAATADGPSAPARPRRPRQSAR